MADEVMHLQVGMGEIACEVAGLKPIGSGVETMTWRKERVNCDDCLGTLNQ